MEEIHSLTDEDVVAALAAAAAEGDPYIANVLTTEAQNRVTQYGAIIRTMAEGIVAVGPMGLITSVNPAAEHMLGWDLEEVKGRPVDGLLACRMASPNGNWRDCSLWEEVAHAEHIWQSEDAVFQRRDGTWFPVAFTVAPIIREGDPYGWVVVFRDITERQRTEAAVRRLAAIVEASDDAILSLGLDGTILTWNPRAEELYGYAASEAIGKHATLVVPPEMRATYHHILSRVASGEGIHHHETQRIQRGGKILTISLTATPIRDEAGRVVAISWIAHDITEAKKTEEALRRSEERYRLLLDSVTDHAIYQLDPKGHVVSWNPAAERLKKWKEKDILGWHYSVLFPPELVASGQPWHELDKAARHGRFSGDVKRIRKDGILFDANVTLSAMRDELGDLVGFVKVTRDVSVRKERERSLKTSEQRYKVLFDLNPNPIAWCDPELRIWRVNDGLKRLLGYAEDEMLGEPLDAFLTPEGEGELIQQVAEAGEAVIDAHLIRKDGSRLAMPCRIVPIEVDGEKAGFFAIGERFPPPGEE